MSMKTRVSAYTLSIALVCSTGAFAQMKAEVIHWWTSAGESASVKVFADQFTKGGGTWVDNAIAGGANARTAGINRMVGGNPPTMMQFNTGKQFDELVTNDLVRDVDTIATAGKWRELMPKPIVDATVRGGKPTWEHNLFRAVVVGHGGADMFRQLYGTRKPDVVKTPKFKETVEIFGK